ncbi:outer membrane protein assembly factor BamD [Helicobacter muridarum]|uniref:Outer membrane protein assembly factor BamD n=1 Tax=Helicobacter muridarum TaxID=216 RepID=A0A377PRX5_9HELI|nr:outer membrane protein assembly factor BamD [Helicobacter muridarum]TLE01444.1 outer membrane protein assembly factor BamD [Helicobacter muridarum]STQ85385.1 putative lipoprotein [Helicobacter muridarum]
MLILSTLKYNQKSPILATKTKLTKYIKCLGLFSKYLLYTLYVLYVIVYIGCSKNKEVIYNQPATFWYAGIFKNIRLGNLETADSYFSSLQSEHINSPLIPEAMLALGQAHLNNEEYILSDFYFKEYLKRYGNPSNADYISYLRLKSHLYAFKNSSKDQQFMSESIALIQDFMQKYPNSRYLPFVHEMEVKFILGQNELNMAIARVYAKNGKKDAEEIYKERVDSILQVATNPKPSKIPWYMLLLNW